MVIPSGPSSFAVSVRFRQQEAPGRGWRSVREICNSADWPALHISISIRQSKTLEGWVVVVRVSPLDLLIRLIVDVFEMIRVSG